MIGDKNMAMEIIEPQSSERDINKLESKNQGLTKMDIKALRQADTIVFEKNHIIGIKELKNDPFETERRYAVPVEYNIETYGRNIEVRNVFHMINWAKGDAVWQTISKMLKTGDEIILDWKIGWGDTDLLSKAGITEDALYLHIKRKGEVKYSFLVGTQTGRKEDGGMLR